MHIYYPPEIVVPEQDRVRDQVCASEGSLSSHHGQFSTYKGGAAMKNRKMLLLALFCIALVLSLILPALAVGASAVVPLPDEHFTSHLEADSSSAASVMALNTSQGLVKPMIAAGPEHIVGLKSDGTVVAVGDNGGGKCNVGGWTDIIQVDADYYHTVGLKSDGTVVTTAVDSPWGIGDVGNWTDIVQVATGFQHTVGLKSDGTVVAAGLNYHVEYCNNYTDVWDGKCDVGNWTDIVQVAAGGYHTVGLKADGSVVTVGTNDYEQCDVGGWTDILQIAAGYGHTIGLKFDGTMVAAGRNTYGQCDVGDWTDIVQIAAGYGHTVGLKSDGTVIAVGHNTYGQCDVSYWDLN